MEEKFKFTDEERTTLLEIAEQLKSLMGDEYAEEDAAKVRAQIESELQENKINRDVFGLNPILMSFRTALLELEEIGMKRDCVLSILLYNSVANESLTIEQVEKEYGASIAHIIRGLVRIHELYRKSPVIESENFRNLLLSFAEDMRVVLIMISERVVLMRHIRDTENNEAQQKVAEEASYLYAPLAHKLGLYKLKSELEDLSLKYLEHDAYYMIKEKLNETKRSRDAYIEKFIKPIAEKLDAMGIKSHIKGRTKSIHSIWQKMKKQQCGFEGIYDLFAIRIIIDSPLSEEKMQCWQTYSLITDMYQPNPKRMKDWISIPKTNGYESLHITVMGPQNKWVEVQIRTKRMDEIAERGLAAHWKYKGVKAESGLDEFLNTVRAALEAKENNPLDLMQDFKMDLYKDEIYVFTPTGELIKLAKGATVLDFAFAIHTKLGSKCVSAKVNGKNVPIKYTLNNGDSVSVITSPAQSPKRDWLNFVVTSKARVKIKQALKEETVKAVEFAKEMLQRRFKNRKIDMDEPTMMRYIKKKGFKTVTDFYIEIAEERLDPNQVIDEYLEAFRKETETNERTEVRSAEEFVTTTPVEEISTNKDVLVIDKNLTGIEYKLAKCCNPIYGDEVFGFVSTQGIKIHRMDCPNAQEMFSRFGYRIIRAKWSGKGDNGYTVTLRVIGRDDIAIVTNITSVIGKESNVTLRSLNINSVDGLFQGNFTVLVRDTTALNLLTKKIKAVNGVKTVERLNS